MSDSLQPTLHLCTSDMDLFVMYEAAVEKHNYEQTVQSCPNAGFDLYCPHTIFVKGSVPDYCHKVNLSVRAVMMRGDQAVAFTMYPRSSLSNTPLMMANHVGIIDSGYRGPLIAAVRNLSPDDYVVETNTRLFQICTPTLESFQIKLVLEEEFDRLAPPSLRGAGGFGSTGR